VAKKDMCEMTQTTSPGKSYQAEYDQLLEQLLDAAPQVGKALVRAHKNRTKELNRYLNQDTLRKHFPGSYFAGLEEVYSVLDAMREAYEQSETLKDIAFLVRRVRADFESAVDAGLAGFNGVVLDTMRDVMEIEYLLRDFLHDKQQIKRWLNADLATLICHLPLCSTIWQERVSQKRQTCAGWSSVLRRCLSMPGASFSLPMIWERVWKVGNGLGRTPEHVCLRPPKHGSAHRP